MKVLVTGANGFIGSHVVQRLLDARHAVRALVRPGTEVTHPWRDAVELARADLRHGRELGGACRGVDAVVHTAARMGGGEPQQFETTVAGTERLLDAARGAGARRVILASSYAVYDWSAIEGRLTEESPVVRGGLVERGAYTIAKVWQERVARRFASEHGFDLTVLRPGFVWGADHTVLSGMGQRYGPFYVVFGRSSLLPLTYVENCADAFVAATEQEAARGETFNVVDDEPVTSWEYTRAWLEGSGDGRRLVSVPYPLAFAICRAGAAAGRRLLGDRADLPTTFAPAKFEATFKPLQFPNDKLHERLGWRPRFGFREALARSGDRTGSGA